jgi:hypothetical protein
MHGLNWIVFRSVFVVSLLAISSPAFAAPVAGDVNDSGVVDAVDVQFIINVALAINTSNRTDIDFDNGRTTDAVDIQLGINAALGLNIDADEDGLSDPAEENLGTSSSDTDSDDDGLGDGDEVLVGRNPAVADAPIEINDIDELQKIGNDPGYPLNGNYFLANSIDASATAAWNGGLGFNPIGTSTDRFTGHFDGQSFTITGLVINRPDQIYVGLFGYVGLFDSAIELPAISRIQLSGGTITGDENVGAICGYIGSGTVSDCHSNSTVSGRTIVGGIFGSCTATVDSCTALGPVTATGETAGGFAGSLNGNASDCASSGNVSAFMKAGGFAAGGGGELLNCDSTSDVTATSSFAGGLIAIGSGHFVECDSSGTVTGGDTVGGLLGRCHTNALIEKCSSSSNVTATAFGGGGGLIGFLTDSDVSQCFADGTVSVTSGFAGGGGLIGMAESSTVRNSFARGNVTCADRTGGLIGDLSGGQVKSEIINCYSMGAVISPGNKGGLLGLVNPFLLPDVTACFWDTQTSGLATSAGGTGLPTAQMMTASTFTDAGWDFASIWGITDGASYPFLLWQVK